MHRYALCPAPWGWHMKRVPPLRHSPLRRALTAAAIAAGTTAACLAYLMLGAWLDA